MKLIGYNRRYTSIKPRINTCANRAQRQVDQRGIRGTGAVVEDCIIFTQTEIGENVKLKYVVADKYAKIVEIKKLNGEKEEMLCIAKGDRV